MLSNVVDHFRLKFSEIHWKLQYCELESTAAPQYLQGVLNDAHLFISSHPNKLLIRLNCLGYIHMIYLACLLRQNCLVVF